METNSLAFLKEVGEMIEARAGVIAQQIMNLQKLDAYHSPNTNELNAAFSKAQGDFPLLQYNRTASYFQKEYSDLAMILPKVLPVLSKYELCVTQYTELEKDGSTILHTALEHSSGQWRETRARVLPPKNDPLCFTSTINQIKRSQLMSLLGLAISDDPLDDDSEIQMADDRQILAKGSQAHVLYNPRERSTECISRDQLDMLEKELTTCPDFVEEIFKGANIQTLADLPRNKFEYTLDKIRKVNLVRSGKRPTAN